MARPNPNPNPSPTLDGEACANARPEMNWTDSQSSPSCIEIATDLSLSLSLSIYPSIYLSIYLSIHLSIYPSIYLCLSLSCIDPAQNSAEVASSWYGGTWLGLGLG